MAASTLAGIMTGIETRLQTISGLRTAPYLADQINPPQAIIAVPPIPPPYRKAFARGKVELDVPVYILIGNTLDRVTQIALATYADWSGTNSIPLAIEGDKTLGGAVDDAIVWDFRPLGVQEIDAIGYVGGIFTVKVIARGV